MSIDYIVQFCLRIINMTKDSDGLSKNNFKLKNVLKTTITASILALGYGVSPVKAQNIPVSVETLPIAQKDYIDYSKTSEVTGHNGIKQGEVTATLQFPAGAKSLHMSANETRTIISQGLVKYGEGGVYRLGSNTLIAKVDGERYMCLYEMNGKLEIEYFDSVMSACRRANGLQRQMEQNYQTHNRGKRSI